MSNRNLPFEKLPRAGLFLIAIAGSIGVFGPAGSVQAGSVFMKNGYIIQGPIVERSEGSVVLGWPNGKVTIHRRFVDSIAYDPAEEKRLAEDELHHAQEAQPVDEEASVLEGPNEAAELPANIDDIVKAYVIRPKAGAAPSAEGSSAGGATEPTHAAGELATGGGQGTAAVIPRPEELLGDRVSDAGLAVSFRPPRGWKVSSAKGIVEVAGPAGSEGLRPSFNVVSLSKGSLSSADCISFLKEEDARELDGFDVLGEGPRKAGAESAFELVCRGARGGRVAVVRQVVVEKGESVWLLSSFTATPGGEPAAAAIEESLKTFEFGAR